MSGVRLAALYGIKPKQLGFCGPEGKSSSRLLFNFLCEKELLEKKAREVLERFAVFPYYKLIARFNGIEDPFDEKIVKAYWIGNNLLDNISSDTLQRMVITEFSRPNFLSRKEAEEKAKKIPKGSKPHHSFHVLVLGSVMGRIELKGKLLDLCRIGWGKVIKLRPDKKAVSVKYQPLVSGKTYQLGQLREKEINWIKDFVPKIEIGQSVSFHWNQVVQILTEEEKNNLKKYTQQTLDILNPRAKPFC